MDNEEYIRVGTCYLKLCRVPTVPGEILAVEYRDHPAGSFQRFRGQYQEIRRLLLFSCPCGLSADVRQFSEYV